MAAGWLTPLSQRGRNPRVALVLIRELSALSRVSRVVYGSLSGDLYASVFEFGEPGIAGRTRFIVKAP